MMKRGGVPFPIIFGDYSNYYNTILSLVTTVRRTIAVSSFVFGADVRQLLGRLDNALVIIVLSPGTWYSVKSYVWQWLICTSPFFRRSFPMLSCRRNMKNFIVRGHRRAKFKANILKFSPPIMVYFYLEIWQLRGPFPRC